LEKVKMKAIRTKFFMVFSAVAVTQLILLAGFIHNKSSKRQEFLKHVNDMAGGASTSLVKPLTFNPPDEVYPGVSPMGHVAAYISFSVIDLGQQLEIPAGLLITSKPGTISPSIGLFCSVPFLEASTQIIGEQAIEVMMPGGGSEIFFRKKDSALGDYQSIDKLWQGGALGQTFIVSRADGWRFTFESGLISEMRTANHRVFHWVRAGQMVEIREDGVDSCVVRAAIGGKAINITINDRHYEIDLNNPKNSNPASAFNLCKMIFPDHSEKTFTLTTGSPSDSDVLTIENENKEKSSFAWDKRTGHVVEAGDWDYTVTDVTYGKVSWPNIKRQNVITKKAEMVGFDPISGVQTAKSPNGDTITTYIISTPGPQFGKSRKVEKIDSNGIKAQLFAADYDLGGRPIRIWDTTRGELRFKYDQHGRMTSCINDGKTILLSDYDDAGRLVFFFDGNSEHTFNFTYKNDGKVNMKYKDGKADAKNYVLEESDVLSISKDIQSSIESNM
jgi:YD repeat-containing protein